MNLDQLNECGNVARKAGDVTATLVFR